MEGVQQPYEISVITDVRGTGDFLPEVKIYPNPTDDLLIVKVNDQIQAHYIASLYDINGVLLIKREIERDETNLSMRGFTPGTYFLKISINEKEIKIFKIIKY